MNCIFCNTSFDKIYLDYIYCEKCDCTYFCNFFSGRTIKLMYLYCNINSIKYRVEIDYSFNYSRICIMPDNIKDTIIIVKEFSYILKDITPQNIENKIKTYTVFS